MLVFPISLYRAIEQIVVRGLNWVFPYYPINVQDLSFITVLIGPNCLISFNSILIYHDQLGHIWTSEDYMNWTLRYTSENFTGGSIFGKMFFSQVANKILLIENSDDSGATQVISSTNGTTWTKEADLGSAYRFGLGDITYGNSTYLMVDSDSNVVSTSTDYINWNNQAPFVGDYFWTYCKYGAGKFVIAGVNRSNNAKIIAYSSDGSNWNTCTINTPTDSYAFTSLIFTKGKFYLTATANIVYPGPHTKSFTRMYTSSDGINWTETTLSLIFAAYKIIYNETNQNFVMVGTYNDREFVVDHYVDTDHETIYTSSDAINWTAVSNSLAVPMKNITNFGDNFMCINDDGKYGYSIAGTGILDKLTASSIASWATRKLLSSYTGSPIAIPSDIGNWDYSGNISLNTFTDINFNGTELDTTKIPLPEDVNKKVAIGKYYDQSGNNRLIWAPYAPTGPFLREPNGSLNLVNGKQVCISDLDSNGLISSPYNPINCKTMIYAVKVNFSAWATPVLEGQPLLYKFKVIYNGSAKIQFNDNDIVSFTSGLAPYVVTIQYFSDTNSLNLRVNGVEVVNSSPQMTQFNFDGYFSLYNGDGQILPNTRVTFGEMHLFNEILTQNDLYLIEQDLISRYS